MNQPFHYIGSKWMLAPKIVELLPSHTTYVEVFGGTLSVLLNKNPSPVEIANDISQDVINFFLQIRNNWDAFKWKVEFSPDHRALFTDWIQEWKVSPPEDPVERAARWFYLVQLSMTHSIKTSPGSWRHSKEKNEAEQFYNSIDNLPLVAKRLRLVQWECEDFEKVILTYDGENTVFYCDPPYIIESTNTYYNTTFTIDDHRRLARVLNSIVGKAIVSYYAHPLVDKLYPSPKWRRLEFETITTMPLDIDEPRETRTEVLLLNYCSSPLDRLLEENASTNKVNKV